MGASLGAEIITHTLLVAPYYKHSIMGPNPILNIKAPKKKRPLIDPW